MHYEIMLYLRSKVLKDKKLESSPVIMPVGHSKFIYHTLIY